jgi:hypothetical protein
VRGGAAIFHCPDGKRIALFLEDIKYLDIHKVDHNRYTLFEIIPSAFFGTTLVPTGVVLDTGSGFAVSTCSAANKNILAF